MSQNRYWVSWYSNYCGQCGHTKPPFQIWISGQSAEDTDICSHGVEKATICAVVDAPNQEVVWQTVKKHFCDYQERFCELRESNFVPNDRFPGYEGNTKIE